MTDRRKSRPQWRRRARPLAAVAATIALAAGAPAAAQPYRWVDAQGSVHYGDRPPSQGAVSIQNLNPAARHRTAPPPPDAEPARRTAEPPGPPRVAPEAPVRSTTGPTQASRPAPEPPSRSTPQPPPAREAPARPAPEATASVPGAVSASAEAPPGDAAAAAARDLMQLSGVDQWMDRIVSLARDEFGEYGGRLEDVEAAWTALARGFRRDEMTPVAARCMVDGLGAEREAALEVLRSPLVQRAQRLREEAANPAQYKEYRRFVSALPDTPPPSSRVALVQALERQGGEARFEIEMRRAVRRAVTAALGQQDRGRYDGTASARAHRAVVEEQRRFHSVTGLLFAYRGLSRSDLEELARVVRTPGSVRLTEVGQECVRAALAAAERRASLETRPGAARRRAAR